ncbi:bestrophin-like domain [Nocardia halotolerans]
MKELWNMLWEALLWVTLVAGIAGACAYGLRRRGKSRDGESVNESVGQVFTLVAGLQVVLASFLLIGVLDTNAAAEKAVAEEADRLLALQWAGDSLPEPARSTISASVRRYTGEVIEVEWPAMTAAQRVEDTAWNELSTVRTAIAGTPAADEWQRSRQIAAADRLWEVYEARQTRVEAAGSSLSPMMWVALMLGAMLSIGLSLMFEGTSARVHVVVVASFAAVVTFMICTIYQLQNPYGRAASIGPDAFTTILGQLT